MSNLSMRAIGFSCIIVIGITILFVCSQRTSVTTIPDTPEALAVMATLDHAYVLLGTPAELIDFAEFDEVFVDHPAYGRAIGARKRKLLRDQISKELGEEAAQTFGYRTSMKSKLIARKNRYAQFRAALTNAEAENRELTQAELDEIAAQNNGYIPTLPDLSTPSSFKRELKYFSLEINRNKARATYDEGVTGRTAILVRIDGKWYVAGIF